MVPSRLRGAVKATYDVIDRVRPDVIVGYGGYVSMPAYLAARRRKLPLVIHEQNALPGIANKVGARFADRVAVSFPDTPLKRAEYVGLPIRRMISQLDRPALRAEARAFFGLDPDLPTLVVTGGFAGCLEAQPRGHPRLRRARHRRRPGAPRHRRARQGGPGVGRAGRDRHAVRRAAVRRADGLRPRRRRPDGVPGRRSTAWSRPPPPACRRSSCRSPTATASRCTTPARSSTPGER